jgi:starch phosphorylase
VGEAIEVTATAALGALAPADVIVEAYFGALRPDGTLRSGRGFPLEWVGGDHGGHLYRGMVPARASGLHGYCIRVLPQHDDMLVPNELPLVAWEEMDE